MSRGRHAAVDFLLSLFVALTAHSAFAISHDAATTSTTFTTSSPMSFDHTPTGIPRGVIVFIAQAGASNDQMVRVTYGGVPLNRIWSASDTAGEPGRVYGFFLGNAVPPGTQTVSVLHSGGSATKIATAITLTGSRDIEMAQLPDRLEQDRANPQLELDSGTRYALRYCVIYSGQNSVGNLTALSGMTALSDNDLGSSVTRIDRETSTSTGSTVIGYVATSDDVAMMAVAFTEITVGGNGSDPVPYVAKIVTTPDTETGASLVDVSGASISAAELDSAGINVGDPVYIQAVAHLGNSGSGNRSAMALVHGSTIFQNLESESIRPEVYATSGNIKATPFLHYLWTRISGEGIKVQFARVDGGIAQIDQIFLLALGLAGLQRNVDWFWSEVGEEVNIVQGSENNGPFTDGASITVVPSGRINRFAVFTTAYIEHAVSSSSKPRTQLTRSGEASDDEPHQGLFGGSANQTSAMGLMRVYSLSRGSRNNLVLQDNQSSTSPNTRRLSSILGLNLDRFRTASSAYTRDEEFLSATDYYTELQSIDIEPDSQSTFWVSGFWGFNPSSVDRDAEFRVQIDNSDDPEGQTTDDYQFNGESSNGGSQGFFIENIANLAPGSHVIELDSSVDSTVGNSGGELRSLFAVEMRYSPSEVPSLGRVGLMALAFCLALVARYFLGSGR